MKFAFHSARTDTYYTIEADNPEEAKAIVDAKIASARKTISDHQSSLSFGCNSKTTLMNSGVKDEHTIYLYI